MSRSYGTGHTKVARGFWGEGGQRAGRVETGLHIARAGLKLTV